MKHEQNKPNNSDDEKKESEEESESPNQKLQDKTDSSKSGILIGSASFQGPLPPPGMYRGYEDVLPGSADRILTIFEKEQNHRINWENESLKVSANEAKRGQLFGFIIAMFCISISAFLAYGGQRLVPSILIGAGASTLVWQFIQKKGK